VLFGEFADLGLVAAHQDRFDLDLGAVFQGEAAGVADGKDGAQQVLAVTHPAGDAVHGDADRLCFEAHVSSTVSEQFYSSWIGKAHSHCIHHAPQELSWQALSERNFQLP
jgi:hypothetical protein